jgi:hypothetical protein
MNRFTGRLLLIVAASALLFAIVPVIAIGASGDFEDVSDSNVFRSDIEWLATVGVTKGCNPPANTKYCPGNPVTREQMAAFMHRLAEGVVDAQTVEGMTAAELKGQKGDPGPQGEKGDPGVASYYTVEAYTAASTVGYYTGDAWCEPGDIATGGGVQLQANSPDFSLMESMPTHSGSELPAGWTPTGWRGEVWLGINLGGGFWTFRTWVVCADMS